MANGSSRCWRIFALSFILAGLAWAQGRPIDANPQGIQYSRGRRWYSTLFGQSAIPVTPLNLHNSRRIYTLMRKGKLYLSLREAIALALENNLDIAIQRLNLPLADSDILQTRAGLAPSGVSTAIVSGTLGGSANLGAGGASGGGAGATGVGISSAGAGVGGIVATPIGGGPAVPSLDPVFTSTLELSNTTTPETSTFLTGTSSLDQHSGLANFNVTKSWLTGTQLTAGFTNERISTNSLTSTFNPYIQSGLNVQLTQPLLEGFGPSVNGRFIMIAKNDRRISNLAFRAQVESTVNQIENIYWGLVSDYNALQYAKRDLQLARQTLADNRRQVQIGTLAPISITQAQAQVATAQQTLIADQTNYEYQQLIMKNAVTKNMNNAALATAAVVPTTKIHIPAAAHLRPVPELIREAMQYRPDLQEARINLANDQISLHGIKNALLPQVNLFASYSATGLAGSHFIPPACLQPNPPFSCNFVKSASIPGNLLGGYPQDFKGLIAGDYPSYTAGFNIQIPIFNRAAQAQAVRAQLEIQQNKLQLQQTTNTIALEVRNASFALQQDLAAVRAARESVRYDRQTLAADQKRLQLGAATILTVNTDETTLAQAESALVGNMAAYQSAHLTLEVLTGRLLTDNDISVSDAIRGHVTRLPKLRD